MLSKFVFRFPFGKQMVLNCDSRPNFHIHPPTNIWGWIGKQVTSNSKLPVPSPLLSFILNLTTATHCTIIFQSQIKRLQNIQNSLACAVTRTPKSSHITPVLKFLHWFKINEHIKYKLLSLTYKVLTNHQPQYLHNLISVQLCHNTRSLSMVTLLLYLPGPLWKSLIALFGMLHFVYGTNSPLIFASLVRYSLLHFHLSHMAVHHHLLHHLHYHHLHLLFLAQSFILNLRLAFSANHFLHRPFPFLPDWFYGLSDHLMFLFCIVC